MRAWGRGPGCRGQLHFERPRPPSQAKLWLIALLVATVVYALCWLYSRHIAGPGRGPSPAESEEASP